eukprot:m.181026 g.181026  ORF g.181026 m.181026 type:complete len:847 (+) comp32047_c0_seq1:104-2644(+)
MVMMTSLQGAVAVLLAVATTHAQPVQPPAQQPPVVIAVKDATDLSQQDAYAACRDRCSASNTCKTWDWDPTTSLCHLNVNQAVVESTATGRRIARPPPTPPPTYTPGMDKLIIKYETEKNATCAQVLPHVPQLNTADAAAFMSAYQAFMGNTSEAPVFAAASKLLTPTLDTFLSLPDSFDSPTGLDAALVKCALMTQAERGENVGRTTNTHLLAAFAVQGAAQEALVDKLLDDAILMRDMLVAGGPAVHGTINGHFGEAMAIYSSLVNASQTLRTVIASSDKPTSDVQPWDDRSPATVLKRLAIGISVALAEPLEHRYAKDLPNASEFVDPVARYQQYEEHYLAGDLDPAFAVLTSFELAHTMDSDATEDDTLWLRAAMANYRPDEIAMTYHWRYAWSVHSDVQYGDSICTHWDGVCNGHYSDIPVGGDVCGGRAFWGRFTRKGFGIPTWGATEHGHAAMSSWTPTGWNVMLGSDWPWTWWGDRGGEDFYLEAQSRENRSEFQKILRGGWVALARDDAPINQMWHAKIPTYSNTNGQGGLWSALTLYKSKIVANETIPMNRTVPSDANNKITALVAKYAQPLPPPAPITTGSDGTITIPASAYTSVVNESGAVSPHSRSLGTAPLYNGTYVVMPSFSDGEQLLSYPNASGSGSITYTVPAAASGNYFLTANFTTFHMDQDLQVSVNNAKTVSVPVFYSVGWWKQTQPVAITLNKGPNTLTFTRNTTRVLSFKEFFLYTHKPVIPQPPGNFTPHPAPAPDQYIEVPASTTCFKQGIEDVPEFLCKTACETLGFKNVGAVNKPNISGCFVETTGAATGTCEYNTNTSATCEPPCTLDGSIVRSLCIRN